MLHYIIRNLLADKKGKLYSLITDEYTGIAMDDPPMQEKYCVFIHVKILYFLDSFSVVTGSVFSVISFVYFALI